MNLKTKQNVKNKVLSAQQAYDKLYPLVGEKYSKLVPTMRWLKNLINGRQIVHKDKITKQINKNLRRK